MLNSPSFLANQKARNAIVAAENLLKEYILENIEAEICEILKVF